MRVFRSMMAVLALIAFHGSTVAAEKPEGEKRLDKRVFELRTYHAAPGKMNALHARFRDHTNKLFKKHGMTIIGYWNPANAEESETTLVYILAYPTREAAAKSWKDFQADPAWQAAKAASEKDGKLVNKVESIFMNATDYSPIK